MKLIYWNIHNNGNNLRLLRNLAEDCMADFLIISEFGRLDVDFNSVLAENYKLVEDQTNTNKTIKMYCKKNCNVSIFGQDARYLIFEINHCNKKYLLVGIHLESRIYKDSRRKRFQTIENLKSHLPPYATTRFNGIMIIGDMNCLPFDDELIGKDHFNAVVCKREIIKKGYDTFDGKKFQRLYNPTVDYIYMNQKEYGSYRYTREINNYIWYPLDQCLMNKALCNKINKYEYITKIKGLDLLNSKYEIKTDISDHLPLFVEIGENNNE